MKIGSYLKVSSVTLAAVFSLIACPIVATADEKELQVDLKDLPAEVRGTAELNAEGGAITEVELEEKAGQKIYSVEVKKDDGSEIEIEIAPDGKLIKVERDDDDNSNGRNREQIIDLTAAPAAVQEVVNRALSDGGKLKTVTRELERGAMVYEAEYTLGNVEHSMKFAENGEVIEREYEVSTSALPNAVTAALQKRFPDAQINEAEEVTLRFYELEIKIGNRKREVKITAAGQILDGEDDDEDDDDED